MPQTPERKKIQQREYCARPDVKEKRAASHAAWMEKNKDKKGDRPEKIAHYSRHELPQSVRIEASTTQPEPRP
jgi:hypothetical protein